MDTPPDQDKPPAVTPEDEAAAAILAAQHAQVQAAMLGAEEAVARAVQAMALPPAPA